MHQELHAQTNTPLYRSALVRLGAQVATIALAIALMEPALAQDAMKPPPTKPTKPASLPKPEPARPQPVKYDFLEAQEYITKINAIAEPQPRGEFETKEAYEARQPKLPDAASTLLRIERGYKDYSYDIDKKVLTIRVPVATIKPRKSLSGLPLQAAYSIDKKEEYTGSNSYGAKVTVEKTWSTIYLLFVPPAQVNSMLKETENPIFATLPESMRARMADTFKERTISVDISAEPRDAERISKNYAVLLRVRPKGLQFSVFEATHSTKPTISEPKESTLFTRAIEVDLLEIVVRDGAMGPELLRQAIGGVSPSPASYAAPMVESAQGADSAVKQASIVRKSGNGGDGQLTTAAAGSATIPPSAPTPSASRILLAQFKVTDGFTNLSREVEVTDSDISTGNLPGTGDIDSMMPPGGWVPPNAESLGRWSRIYQAADGTSPSKADLKGQVGPRLTIGTPLGPRMVIPVTYEGWVSRTTVFGGSVVQHKAVFRIWYSPELGLPVKFESSMLTAGAYKRESKESLELVAVKY